MTDRIEKAVDLQAPIARVWRALTDHREFGQWFGVVLDGPFVPGEITRGRLTVPSFERVQWQVTVQAMEPEALFSFTWHPYAVDPDTDYSSEPPTLVEFRLEPSAGGTRLTVTESGFEALPEGRRMEALRMNESGWAHQVTNVQAHVEQ